VLLVPIATMTRAAAVSIATRQVGGGEEEEEEDGSEDLVVESLDVSS